MYLKQLNKEQKEIFLDLCISGALSNNDFAIEQKNMIDLYCEEMEMENARYTSGFDTNEALDKMVKMSTKQVLKMVFVEITALILSDNKFDQFEKEFMEQVVKSFEIGQEEFDDVLRVLRDISRCYTELNNFVTK